MQRGKARPKPVSLIHAALLSARFMQGCVFPFSHNSSLHTHNSPLYNYQHENVSDEIAGRQRLMLQTESVHLFAPSALRFCYPVRL